jgi:hypothetical protein
MPPLVDGNIQRVIMQALDRQPEAAEEVNQEVGEANPDVEEEAKESDQDHNF